MIQTVVYYNNLSYSACTRQTDKTEKRKIITNISVFTGKKRFEKKESKKQSMCQREENAKQRKNHTMIVRYVYVLYMSVGKYQQQQQQNHEKKLKSGKT